MEGVKSSKINDPFSSLPAFALHHHFKASNINKCTTESCLWFSPILPFLFSAEHSRSLSMPGEAQEGLWGHKIGGWLVSFALIQVLSGWSSFHQHHCPDSSRNFLSPNCLSPLCKPLKAGRDRGDKRAGCSHVSSPWQTLGSAQWTPAELTHVSCLEPPQAISYPRAVRESFWFQVSPSTAVPCLPSPCSSAPMGCTAPASASLAAACPHSAANAATRMRSKELSAPAGGESSVPVPAPSHLREPSWGRGWRRFCPFVCRDLRIGISSLLQGTGVSRKGIPGWEKGCTVLEVQPWLMGSREKRDHSPFSAPEWSNKELLISYMLFLTVIWCEKLLKRNLQSISGRALNWWEKTTVIFIHPKSLGDMI